jgi:hypothetical protein
MGLSAVGAAAVGTVLAAYAYWFRTVPRGRAAQSCTLALATVAAAFAFWSLSALPTRHWRFVVQLLHR